MALQEELEAEAKNILLLPQAEATNFIWSHKRKQKIPRVRKRKQNRKHGTLRGAESGSKKYSTASTSLL